MRSRTTYWAGQEQKYVVPEPTIRNATDMPRQRRPRSWTPPPSLRQRPHREGITCATSRACLLQLGPRASLRHWPGRRQRACLLFGAARRPVDRPHAPAPQANRIQPLGATRHRRRDTNAVPARRRPHRRRGRDSRCDACPRSWIAEGRDRHGSKRLRTCRHYRSLIGHRLSPPLARPPSGLPRPCG